MPQERRYKDDYTLANQMALGSNRRNLRQSGPSFDRCDTRLLPQQ